MGKGGNAKSSWSLSFPYDSTGFYARKSEEKVFREIKVMESLSHPYILKFCGWCSHPLSILLEYCSRGDLKSFYAKQDFTVSRRNSILLHIAVCVFLARQRLKRSSSSSKLTTYLDSS